MYYNPIVHEQLTTLTSSPQSVTIFLSLNHFLERVYREIGDVSTSIIGQIRSQSGDDATLPSFWWTKGHREFLSCRNVYLLFNYFNQQMHEIQLVFISM